MGRPGLATHPISDEQGKFNLNNLVEARTLQGFPQFGAAGGIANEPRPTGASRAGGND